jgi:hypothetical protein
MRSCLLALAAVALAGPALAAEEVPLDLKTGAWETTMTQITMPEASVIAALPPEQRAAIEDQARSSGVPQTSTECQTKEDLEKGLLATFAGPGCVSDIAESTPKTLRATVTCQDGKSTAIIEADAPNPETMNAVIELSEKGGARNILTATGKFLSDTCPAQ